MASRSSADSLTQESWMNKKYYKSMPSKLAWASAFFSYARYILMLAFKDGVFPMNGVILLIFYYFLLFVYFSQKTLKFFYFWRFRKNEKKREKTRFQELSICRLKFLKKVLKTY